MKHITTRPRNALQLEIQSGEQAVPKRYESMPRQRPYARDDKKALFCSQDSTDYAGAEEG